MPKKMLQKMVTAYVLQALSVSLSLFFLFVLFFCLQNGGVALGGGCFLLQVCKENVSVCFY